MRCGFVRLVGVLCEPLGHAAVPMTPSPSLTTRAHAQILKKHNGKQEQRRKRQELLQQLQEKQEELDRLVAEEESLLRVRHEQELMIGRLSDPIAAAAGGGFS